MLKLTRPSLSFRIMPVLSSLNEACAGVTISSETNSPSPSRMDNRSGGGAFFLLVIDIVNLTMCKQNSF
jgi:hypothetical protein